MSIINNPSFKLTFYDFQAIWKKMIESYYSDKTFIWEEIYLVARSAAQSTSFPYEPQEVFFACDRSISRNLSSFVYICSSGIYSRESHRRYYHGPDLTPESHVCWEDLMNHQIICNRNNKVYIGERFVLSAFPLTTFLFRFMVSAQSYLRTAIYYPSWELSSFSFVEESALYNLNRLSAYITHQRPTKYNLIQRSRKRVAGPQQGEEELDGLTFDAYHVFISEKNEVRCKLRWRDLLLSSSMSTKGKYILLDCIKLCKFSKRRFEFLRIAHSLIWSHYTSSYRNELHQPPQFLDPDKCPPPAYQKVVQQINSMSDWSNYLISSASLGVI
eukprot:TRINITY_DN1461_c0_g1_i1.p1 TRINITY_DN1461_c0_g1~~TRINITY_DN1461_c0_g1_i1.p1  ORF type:complete len:329 (-),score=22.06 TRINITY_DN1461_c0_g1_i1:65-1051(-)